MNTAKHKLMRRFFAVALGIVLASFLGAKSGQFLVIDKPRHSDLIVVLSQDFNDIPAERGLMLLREGYAQQLVLDAPDWIHYGRNQAEAANDFLLRTAPDQAGRVHVCSISPDSTHQEMTLLGQCIHRIAPNATSGLLVTSDFLTRRSLDMAQRILPRYQWSVTAALETNFSVQWWRNRESAKIVFTEWQKLLWWKIVEQWTSK